MAAARKRSESKARTATSGRVKGARGGPATRKHPETPPTRRASSKARAAKKGESLDKPTLAERKRTDIGDADVAKVPTLRRARSRDLGE